MQTIAIANSKGGTGKTTTARNLGQELSQKYRVLLIDLDPQASLTESLQLAQATTHTIGQVFTAEKHLQNVIVNVSNQLDIAPASDYLLTVENGLRESPTGTLKLKNALKGIVSNYDFCIIDTIGTASLLVFNALIASNAVIVPTRPEGTDLRALAKFLQEIVEDISTNYHESKLKTAILPNQYNEQSKHHQEAIEAFRKSGYKVLPPIGRSVKVAEAMYEQKALTAHDRHNARNEEYETLASEVIKWLKKQSP